VGRRVLDGEVIDRFLEISILALDFIELLLELLILLGQVVKVTLIIVGGGRIVL
jgi:hypothetical protein